MTNDPSTLVLVFYAGILAQALFLIVGRIEWKEWWGVPVAAGFALIGMMPGKNEDVYDTFFHFFLSACFFAVAFTWYYRKYLLNEINREILLAWNLIFIYALARAEMHPYLLIGAVVIGLILFINLFQPFDLHQVMQTTMYTWFLLMVAGVSVLYVSLSNLGFFFRDGQPPYPEIAAMFFVGSAFMFVVSSLYFVYQLIPIPRKHQSFSSKMEEVREHAQLLAVAYDESKSPLTLSVLSVSAVGVLLISNYVFGYVSDDLLIPFAVTVSYLRKRPVIKEDPYQLEPREMATFTNGGGQTT